MNTHLWYSWVQTPVGGLIVSGVRCVVWTQHWNLEASPWSVETCDHVLIKQLEDWALIIQQFLKCFSQLEYLVLDSLCDQGFAFRCAFPDHYNLNKRIVCAFFKNNFPFI